MHDIPSLEPLDEHNRNLRDHVHPLDWQNPKPDGRYHLVVIGAGTAGLVTAAGAAGLGAKVALVERNLMGGDCLNVGCVPSKAIIRAARAAAEVRSSHQFGIHGGAETTVDFPAVMERTRMLRASISPHDSAARFRELGVDVYFGSAQFRDSDTIEVDGTSLKFRKAVIATGSRPAIPNIAGLDQVPYLTNETLFSLTELPPRLGVIGAGPIGCEMAQAFAQLGSQVTLFDYSDSILPKDDRDASGIVQRAMEHDGVRIRSDCRITEIQSAEGIRLLGDANGTPFDDRFDRILVATGRRTNFDGLNLDAVGIKHNTHGIEVNDHLRTTNSRVFAAGDCCSKFKFTHAADFMARIVIQNALFLGRRKMSALTIPWCTYTTPELAHVGLTELLARERDIGIDTFQQSFRGVDRAVLDGEPEGFVKVHLRKGTDRIVGATIVARHAGELISQITLAMTNNVGLSKIGSTIHPYPTQAEAIRKLGDQYSRTRLTPLVKSLLHKWLKWTA